MSLALRAAALTGAIRERALALGFDRVGVGPADPPEHGAAFERWLDAGYAGTMAYLARGRTARLDPRVLLPGARSVIAVAVNYRPAPSPEADVDGWAGVALYAHGHDYHDLLRPRLEALAETVRELTGPETESRACVDTSAVLERDLAARAGLGWIGKNTNVIDQTLGSFFFLGIVLTTAELAPEGPVPDRCGTCTACLDACPTGAFVAPYVLDARRCISYLTIEHRGPIDAALRESVGEWLFGCDVCQTVCPWNRKAPATTDGAWQPSGPLEPPDALLELDDEGFRQRFKGSPIRRTKRSGLRRNAALVLGNTREPRGTAALRRCLEDADPVVRDAAAWALRRIERRDEPDAPATTPL